MSTSVCRRLVISAIAVSMVTALLVLLPSTPAFAQAGSVVINEVMASNDSTISDSSGEFDDWIELRNTTASPVSLAGWTLSDSGATWAFPAGATIPANGLLVVWADDDDSGASLVEYHTNFRLTSGGESVTLANGATTIDSISYPPLLADQSYGLPPAGSAAVLVSATPGAANSAAAGSGNLPVVTNPGNQTSTVPSSVSLTVVGSDADGDVLTWTATGLPPGLVIDPASGEIFGSVFNADIYAVTVTANDGLGGTASASFEWTVTDSTPVSGPLILNEYNAVASDQFLVAPCADTTFGQTIGNGGDWFELVVTQDNLDLRGYSVALYDVDDEGNIDLEDTFTFTNAALFGDLRAGTIITIAESVPDDVSYDPANGDWTINLQATSADEGAFITPDSQSNFDTNSTGWRVVILDPGGNVVSPIAGETEVWDIVNGGVGSQETFALAADPAPGVDPVGDYTDNCDSTFGAPNVVAGAVQDFSGLRPTVSGPTPTPTVTTDPTPTAIATLEPTATVEVSEPTPTPTPDDAAPTVTPTVADSPTPTVAVPTATPTVADSPTPTVAVPTVTPTVGDSPTPTATPTSASVVFLPTPTPAVPTPTAIATPTSAPPTVVPVQTATVGPAPTATATPRDVLALPAGGIGQLNPTPVPVGVSPTTVPTPAASVLVPTPVPTAAASVTATPTATATPARASGSASDGTLAVTGSESANLLGIATIFVLLGAAALVEASRRRLR